MVKLLKQCLLGEATVHVECLGLNFISFLHTCQKKEKKRVSPLYVVDASYVVHFAGRLVFLSKGNDAQQAAQSDLKGVGYY